MAQGISIHIGLNKVNTSAYPDYTIPILAGCINDARAMKTIADSMGYSSTLLLDDQATAAAVISAIGRAAKNCVSGDMVLLTYSGHGAQVPDANGDEDDGLDETWVLYDRMLIDDELFALWGQFQAGVRIFMLSDSCHSGTVAKMIVMRQVVALTSTMVTSQSDSMRNKDIARLKSLGPSLFSSRSPTQVRALVGNFKPVSKAPRFRLLPYEAALAAYNAHKAMYESRQWANLKGNNATVNASVILISGCQDNQLSGDGDVNGRFTQSLLEVWNKGEFTGSYKQFWQAINNKMPSTQTPNYYTVGADNPTFESQNPFTIDGSGSSAQNGGSSSGPTINAVNASQSRSDGPPRFQVDPSPNQYYIVEFATQPELFDFNGHSSERTDNNFYGSWSDSSFLTGASYTLGEDVWNRLNKADHLYYRVGSSSSQTGYDNYMVSTLDQNATAAPSIEITGDGASTNGDSSGGDGGSTEEDTSGEDGGSTEEDTSGEDGGSAEEDTSGEESMPADDSDIG